MGLPKITVVPGNKESEKFVNDFVGKAKFKLISNARYTGGLKAMFGVKSVHDKDKGALGRAVYCKECGDTSPVAVMVDSDNNPFEWKSGTSAEFVVIGKVPRLLVDYKWIQKSYFMDGTENPEPFAHLTEGLRDTGLLGYVRLSKDYDERPAVLTSPEPGVLVLHMLYYYETELWSSLPVSAEEKYPLPAGFDKSVKELPTVDLHDFPHREALAMAEAIAKSQKAVKTKG